MFNPPCVIRHGSHTAILVMLTSRHAYVIEMAAGERVVSRISADQLNSTWTPMEYDVKKAATTFAEKFCTPSARAHLDAIIQGTSSIEEDTEMAYDPAVPTTPAAAKAGKGKATPAVSKVTPKPAKAAKEAPEGGEEGGKRGRSAAIPDTAKITSNAAQRAIVAGMREGSKRREMMELIQANKTVGDAKEAGVLHTFIAFAAANDIATIG